MENQVATQRKISRPLTGAQNRRDNGRRLVVRRNAWRNRRRISGSCWQRGSAKRATEGDTVNGCRARASAWALVAAPYVIYTCWERQPAASNVQCVGGRLGLERWRMETRDKRQEIIDGGDKLYSEHWSLCIQLKRRTSSFPVLATQAIQLVAVDPVTTEGSLLDSPKEAGSVQHAGWGVECTVPLY